MSFYAPRLDLLGTFTQANEVTMTTRLSLADARAHLPKLILSRHVNSQVHGDSLVGRINTRLALIVTKAVGSMWCAYAFGLLALISLPAALLDNPASRGREGSVDSDERLGIESGRVLIVSRSGREYSNTRTRFSKCFR